jgi:hypothetical protein
MPSTRTTENGTFRQERWASSPALDRALKANLVAARVSVLESAEQREIVWFLQSLSLFNGGLRWAASEVTPDYIAAVPEIRETWLASLCLDPASNFELQTVLPQLRQLMAGYIRQKSEGVAITEIGRAVCEALDYCSLSRCLMLINGSPRRGKTFAAQKWIEQHPGRARYCQVPSSADDLAFFTAIARALGITIESNAKTKNLRPRIESALQGGDLTLVLDEAANLYPSHNYRLARPSRISWLLTGLINQGASVALLVTPQFFNTQSDYVDKSGWAAAQFMGQIEKFVLLPDTLPIADLEKVARAWLPNGDKRSIEVLVDFAALSQKYLAAIEHTVKQAIYLARQAGRETPDWTDIKTAVKTGSMPADAALSAAISRAAVRRKLPAINPRN